MERLQTVKTKKEEIPVEPKLASVRLKSQHFHLATFFSFGETMPDFNAFYESFFSDCRQEEEPMEWEDVPFLPEVSAPFIPSRPPRKMRSLISVQVSEPPSLSANRFPNMRALVPKHMTATARSDVVQSRRPIFDDFFQHLWPYIGNNTANVVFQMVKRLWLICIDQ
ncbi:hypothetical protein TNCV_1187331 [Trichonephila clavipes]|nr:hypothetical protein TNCV_1187331 [Trichonephila clavipes]